MSNADTHTKTAAESRLILLSLHFVSHQHILEGRHSLTHSPVFGIFPASPKEALNKSLHRIGTEFLKTSRLLF